MNIADILHTGKKISNYEIDATGATALWPSTTEYKAIVPADKRWLVTGGIVARDVSSTAYVYARSATDQVLKVLGVYSAGTSLQPWPHYSTGQQVITPIVLDAGEYILIGFGTAQGAGAYCSCNVVEISA